MTWSSIYGYRDSTFLLLICLTRFSESVSTHCLAYNVSQNGSCKFPLPRMSTNWYHWIDFNEENIWKVNFSTLDRVQGWAAALLFYFYQFKTRKKNLSNIFCQTPLMGTRPLVSVQDYPLWWLISSFIQFICHRSHRYDYSIPKWFVCLCVAVEVVHLLLWLWPNNFYWHLIFLLIMSFPNQWWEKVTTFDNDTDNFWVHSLSC